MARINRHPEARVRKSWPKYAGLAALALATLAVCVLALTR